MIPLHQPAPTVLVTLPPPLARDAPTETVTATAPARLTEPETRPPPADETRLPVTVKGTLKPERQLPRVVANTTFQTPS
jgi:hypothetical protein